MSSAVCRYKLVVYGLMIMVYRVDQYKSGFLNERYRYRDESVVRRRRFRLSRKKKIFKSKYKKYKNFRSYKYYMVIDKYFFNIIVENNATRLSRIDCAVQCIHTV